MPIVTTVPLKLALSGGDIFFTGPASVVVNFSVNFHTFISPCLFPFTVVIELLLDGVVVASTSAASSSGVASGSAMFNVDANVHSVGLNVSGLSECGLVIDGGTVALTASCINPRIPPTIIGA